MNRIFSLKFLRNLFKRPDPSELYITLKYFSPFDINRIPRKVLENVYYQTVGLPAFNYTDEYLADILGNMLPNHLEAAIRAELLKQHE